MRPAFAVTALCLAGCAGLQVRVGAPREGGAAEPAPTRPAPAEQRQPQSASAGGYALEPRWRPLERIEERVTLPIPGLSSTTATTISPVLYVSDLAGWLKRHPPGSPHFEALLVHEQLHAHRQERAGVDPWIQRYLRDREFMWAEEQRGWYAQIQRLQQAGFIVDPAAVARTLTAYRNLAGPMVGAEEALRWAQDAVQNRWRAPPE